MKIRNFVNVYLTTSSPEYYETQKGVASHSHTHELGKQSAQSPQLHRPSILDIIAKMFFLLFGGRS